MRPSSGFVFIKQNVVLNLIALSMGVLFSREAKTADHTMLAMELHKQEALGKKILGELENVRDFLVTLSKAGSGTSKRSDSNYWPSFQVGVKINSKVHFGARLQSTWKDSDVRLKCYILSANCLFIRAAQVYEAHAPYGAPEFIGRICLHNGYFGDTEIKCLQYPMKMLFNDLIAKGQLTEKIQRNDTGEYGDFVIR